jgi:4-hydroxybenzoate polyprenyltransferase
VLRACLQLLRPANVTTALADVLAGFAIAGLGNRAALPWLLLATAALYAGGIVLNDVFDREIDKLERPDRPIPSAGSASSRPPPSAPACSSSALPRRRPRTRQP